jgi:hypothetical protein
MKLFPSSPLARARTILTYNQQAAHCFKSNLHPSIPFKFSPRKMSTQSQPQPTFSTNYSPEQGIKDLTPLLKSNGGKWALTESRKGVERTFKFKTFKKTWVRFVFFLSVF